MLYLAIDQHKCQLTVNIRNEHGDIVQKGQVSTNHAEIDDFFDKFAKKARQHRGFMAIVEICGFNDWLLEKLQKSGCSEIVVIQPDHSSNKKTDRRDANVLCELLWNNRKRLQGGQRPNGIRRIFPADPQDAQIRQLVNFRQHLVAQRTKTVNKIKGVINKHNMAQDAPTEKYDTKKFRQWIATVQLPAIDRIEVDMNLESWKLYDKQVLEIEVELAKRSETNPEMFRLKSIPGISAMGAVTLLSRIGDIKRFKTPGSLANYFGLTPGCHNTAGKQCLGGITKMGSPAARQVLNFAVLHIVRKDPEMKAWHKKIKSRKGAKTARVAVMRKLATIIWHMLRWGKPYQFRYEQVRPLATKTKTKRNAGGPSAHRFSRDGNSNRQGIQEKTPSKSRGKTKA